jgi:hypothetical protein
MDVGGILVFYLGIGAAVAIVDLCRRPDTIDEFERIWPEANQEMLILLHIAFCAVMWAPVWLSGIAGRWR